MHLRILAISHCDIAVSHLISSSLLPRPVPSHSNSTTSSFLTRGSRLVSSRLLVISWSQRPRAVLSFWKVKTNLRRLHPIRAARASSTASSKSNSTANYRRNSTRTISIMDYSVNHNIDACFNVRFF